MTEETQTQSSELVVVINQSGLEKETATTLLEKFAPLFEKAEEWKRKAESLVITDVSQKREMQEARIARLALKEIRVDADKTRKALKEDSLRYGKAVQGVYNVIEYLIAPIEKHLQEQEDFAEIQEAKVKAALKEERLSALSPYGVVDNPFVDLANMPQENFDAYLAGVKKSHEDKIAAEQKAEQDRLDAIRKEEEAREAQRLENERLKAEAEQREKELKAERERAEAERKEQEKILAVERAKAEAERKESEKKAQLEREQSEAKAKAEREEQARILAKERAERERVEKELKDKAEAERKAKEQEDAKKEHELSMGDADKFESLIADLASLKEKYQFKSKKHQALYASANELLDKTIAYLNNKK